MAVMLLPRDAVLHSTDATWTADDWEQLPDDGRWYEILAGVLYMSTAPSPAHQLIVLEIIAILCEQLVRQRDFAARLLRRRGQVAA
jgi:hypothetical protein